MMIFNLQGVKMEYKKFQVVIKLKEVAPAVNAEEFLAPNELKKFKVFRDEHEL